MKTTYSQLTDPFKSGLASIEYPVYG